MADSTESTRSSQAWHRELAERDRAARAAQVAARHDLLAQTGPRPARPLHLRMADIHRQIQRRHLVTARLYATMAASQQEPRVEAMPPIMSAVAEVSGSSGAIAVLVGSGDGETVVLTSDAVAASAHDLEFKLGEGPSGHALRTGQPVVVTGQRRLCEQWQLYGPEVARLNVHVVAAAPLRLGKMCLGALTLLNPAAGAWSDEIIGALGEALTYSLLDGELSDGDDILAGPGDHRPVVHQAAGVLSVRNDCSVADALALIRARAFAHGTTAGDVARDVLAGVHDLP